MTKQPVVFHRRLGVYLTLAVLFCAVLAALGAGFIFDQWCREMVRERASSIRGPAGGSTPPWAALPISGNGSNALPLKKPSQYEIVSVPPLLDSQLIRLPGLDYLLWYDSQKKKYYFWSHPANAGFLPSEMVDELERMKARSEGRVKIITEVFPLCKYQLAGKKYLCRFDMTENFKRLGLLSAIIGIPLVFLLIFLLWWITYSQSGRMVKAIDGIEKSLRDIFMGNYEIKFAAQGFTFTQRIANIISQMVYFFNQNLKQREIKHQRDILTGLYTRRYLLDAMEKEIKRTKRYNHALSFIMIDIDHFKLFNDTYGHLLGDKVLSQTARILKEQTRETDIIGRYGGEEMGIVLSETLIKQALGVAEKLRQQVEKSKYTYNQKTVHVTISMGVTSFLGGDEDTVQRMIQRADEALYDAKKNGRNRVCRRI